MWSVNRPTDTKDFIKIKNWCFSNHTEKERTLLRKYLQITYLTQELYLKYMKSSQNSTRKQTNLKMGKRLRLLHQRSSMNATSLTPLQMLKEHWEPWTLGHEQLPSHCAKAAPCGAQNLHRTLTGPSNPAPGCLHLSKGLCTQITPRNQKLEKASSGCSGPSMPMRTQTHHDRREGPFKRSHAAHSSYVDNIQEKQSRGRGLPARRGQVWPHSWSHDYTSMKTRYVTPTSARFYCISIKNYF